MTLNDLNAILIKTRLAKGNILKRLYTTWGGDKKLNNELDEIDGLQAYVILYQYVNGYVTDVNGNLSDQNLLSYIQRLQGIINRYRSPKPIQLTKNYSPENALKRYPLFAASPIFLKANILYQNSQMNTDTKYASTATVDSLNQTLLNMQAVIYNLQVQGQVGSPTSVSEFVFTQQIPNVLWAINHKLNRIPASVRCANDAGETIVGEPINIDINNTNIIFSSPISGKAYLI